MADDQTTDYAAGLLEWAAAMVTDEQRGFLTGAADEIRRLRAVLTHIATMDCLTRDGEEPIHMLMMRLAQEAIDG